MSTDLNPDLRAAYEARLLELKLEHRDLDVAIHQMQSTSMT